ncbi:hypothetical protein SUGI_0240990 [Cryptomeria japonica]|nr:hypothetical protein SUGI_0240990 [Cryptomeria japonica]
MQTNPDAVQKSHGTNLAEIRAIHENTYNPDPPSGINYIFQADTQLKLNYSQQTESEPHGPKVNLGFYKD